MLVQQPEKDSEQSCVHLPSVKTLYPTVAQSVSARCGSRKTTEIKSYLTVKG